MLGCLLGRLLRSPVGSSFRLSIRCPDDVGSSVRSHMLGRLLRSPVGSSVRLPVGLSATIVCDVGTSVRSFLGSVKVLPTTIVFCY